jgi:hypothetical protein
MILSGCKTSKKESAEATQQTEDQMAKEIIIENLSGYPIPTSMEITDMLHEAGAAYILTLSNPANRVGNYISSADKALNLGVYGTDLSYASTYGIKQETMKFLEASKRLIDELEIETAFKSDYVGRVEENLDMRDSMILIITDSFYDTWNYLVENEKDKLAILVVSGSYIEGLYLTSQIAGTAVDNTKFLEIIAAQKGSLNTLIGILEQVKDDDDIAVIYTGLLDLSEIFKEVDETLTDEQLEHILNTIEPLRESIV